MRATCFAAVVRHGSMTAGSVERAVAEHGRIALEAAADRRADSYSSFVDVNRCSQEADFLLGDVRLRGQSWQANLYASANWALASHFFNVGLALSFLSAPVTYFLVGHHDVSSAVLNSYRCYSHFEHDLFPG